MVLRPKEPTLYYQESWTPGPHSTSMLAISMLRPEQIKWIYEQLKRLEGLNVPPEQKKAIRERWEKLKSQPVPDGPVRLREHRSFRIPTGYLYIPSSPPALTWKQRVARGEKYTPPVLSPEGRRTKREEVAWHAQVGLYRTKRALEQANTYEQREAALRGIGIFREMLERNKE